MHKFLNIFFSLTILITSMTPSYAGLLNSPEKTEEFADMLEKYGSLRTAQTFKGAADKTAAGILHYTEHEEQTLVLLGLRNDNNTWCNFGGKSDEDEYLHETAAREVSEESNGIYATHPEIVKILPYTDLINSQGTYYRMYWQQMPYIPAERLLAKMQNGAGGHNAEYTEFKWVAIHELTSLPGLYTPLAETLSTAAGHKFLKYLGGNPRALQSFSPTIANLKNRVFQFDRQPIADKDGKLYGSIKRFFFSKNDQWFYQDQILPSTDKTEPEPVETPKSLAEKQLAKAVSAHAAAMAQIKKRLADDVEPQDTPLDVPPITNTDLDPNLWNSDPRYTLTRSHLRLVLGDIYNDRGTRAADLENLKTYYSRYGGTDEFKHDTDANDDDYEVLADAMAFEAEHPWPVFFHAADDQLNQLWQSFTKTLGIADANPMTQSLRLRGTDIYFNPRLDKTSGAFEPLNTVEKVNRLAPGGDYENGRASIILCANQGMTPGLKTTSTTSSSLAYFLSNHSVQSQSSQDRFAESFALSGFDEPNYAPYYSLFEQYMNAQHAEKSNSVMLALAVNPRVLNDLVYPSHGGGRPFEVLSTHQKNQKTSSILASLHHIQQAAMAQTPDAPVKLDRLRTLYSEARILLAPEKFYDPTYVHVKGFSRFPLSDQAQSAYEKSMEQLSIETLSNWLSSNNRLIEGAWHKEPRARILYHMVYPAVFGEPVMEKNGRKGFFYLLNNNMIDAAKAVIEQDPSLQEHLNSPTQVQGMVHGLLGNLNVAAAVRLMRDFNIPYAFLEANPHTIKFLELEVISEGSGLGLEYLLEYFYTPQNSLSAVFESKILPELNEVLEGCFFDGDEDIARYVHLLFENLSEAQREFLFAKILEMNPSATEFQTFVDRAPFSDETKRQMLVDYLNALRLTNAYLGSVTKEYIEKYFPTKEIAMGLNPKTNTPYLFELFHVNFYGIRDMVKSWELVAEANAFLKREYDLGLTVHESLDSFCMFMSPTIGLDTQARQWFHTAMALGRKVDGSVQSFMAFFQVMENSIDGFSTPPFEMVPYTFTIRHSAQYNKIINVPDYLNIPMDQLVEVIVTSGDKKELIDYLNRNPFMTQLCRELFVKYSVSEIDGLNKTRYRGMFQPLIDDLQKPDPIPADRMNAYFARINNPLAWRFYMAKTLLENVKRENLKTVIDFLYPGDRTTLFRLSMAPFEIPLENSGTSHTIIPPINALQNNPNLTPLDILEIFTDEDINRTIKDQTIPKHNLRILEAFEEAASLKDYPLTMQALIEDEVWYGTSLEYFGNENVYALIGHDLDAFTRFNNRGMSAQVLKVFFNPQCFELSGRMIEQDPTLILSATLNGIPIMEFLDLDQNLNKKSGLTIRKLYNLGREKMQTLEPKS